MPPRRRATKAFAGQDFSTDDEEPAIPALGKPNLPKLRGTPSSRRQYTYGSDAEPVASPRYSPGDLSKAVKGALSRQQEEDRQSARARMPPPPPPRPAADDEDQTDELAADHQKSADEPRQTEKQRRTGRPSQPKASRSYLHSEDTAAPQRSGITSALEQKSHLVDAADDVRSFGTESDVFGEATIVSSPGIPPVVSHLSQPISKQTRPPLPGRPQGSVQPSSSEESEPRSSRESLTRTRISKALGTSEKLKPQPTVSQTVRRSPRKSRLELEAASEPAEKQEPQRRDVMKQGRALLGLQAPRVSFATSGTRHQQFASHHSEQDDAIQQEIEASEARSQSAASPSPWRDRWMKVQALSPFRATARRSLVEESPTDEEEEQEQEAVPRDFQLPGEVGVDWGRILSPETYLQPIFRLLDYILDGLFLFLTTIKQWISAPRNFNGVSFVLLAIATVFFGMFVPWASVLEHGGNVIPSPASWNVGQNLESIGGYIRSIPLPFWGKDRSGLWELGDGLHEVEDYLRQYEKEFATVKKTGLLHGDAIKKLQSIVPSVVHMELKDGKPVVSEAFWHAIRDLVRGDENVLTIEKNADGAPHINSDRRWRAIAAKLTTDPVFQTKLNLSLKGVEDDIDRKMASHWDGWIKDNDERVLRLVQPLLDKLPTPPPDIDLDARIEELVRQQIGNRQPTEEGVVVSRDEFLRHLKKEFSTHRSEIRSELDELRPRLEKLIKDTVAAANVHPAPSTMTREEITSLVHGLLRKALSEASLEALANGKIHSHFELELKNEVNHFAQGAGSTINVALSSKTWDPMGHGIARDYSRGVRGALAYPHVAALDSWFEEGDCWCAARDVNHRGNPHGVTLAVQLGRRVIPKYLVIDHILPGATTEPGARPREIEIYADIEDSTIRERVRDFSATHFPEPTDWNSHQANLPATFVKIGRFVYEGAELHDGTQLYRLSEELIHLGAATDQIAVRAISNYGAPNHTCFYRLRLFGKQVAG